MEYKGSIIRRKNGKCSSNDIFIFYGADTTQGFPGKHGRLRMGPGLLGRDVQLPPAQQPPESRTMGEIRRFDTGLLQAEERGEASETAAAATIKAGWTHFWITILFYSHDCIHRRLWRLGSGTCIDTTIASGLLQQASILLFLHLVVQSLCMVGEGVGDTWLWRFSCTR